MGIENLARGALWYAARGWPVLPCRGKRPLTSHGALDATTDPATVEAWWRKWPRANPAIATGKASGLWVLDVDHREGMQAMAELERQHSALPPTVTSLTGGGGLHLFWRMPEGTEPGNRARMVAGVDVRATGGYVVVPPARHPSGGTYRWHPERGPHQIELAIAPAWLLAIVTGDRRGAGANGGARSLAEKLREVCPQGQRNSRTAELAGHLLATGLWDDVVTELLIGWSAARCKPPLPEREIKITVASIARRERRRRFAP